MGVTTGVGLTITGLGATLGSVAGVGVGTNTGFTCGVTTAGAVVAAGGKAAGVGTVRDPDEKPE
jgi:hypothetical protein